MKPYKNTNLVTLNVLLVNPNTNVMLVKKDSSYKEKCVKKVV